jgi:hypothetical protein
MRKILFILLCLISIRSVAQVYQEMPQYGYRANRMAFDSTLSIPTTCGVPTLKSNVIKKAAIAFDSCNNKIYKYNPKTAIWSEVGGGVTPNLQQVTDSGNSTSNNIIVIDSTNSVYSSLTNEGINWYNDTISKSGFFQWNGLGFSNGLSTYILNPNYDSINSFNITIPNKSGTIALTSDTANKWVNNIYRKSGKDSIFFQIGSTEYKIKDSIGGAGQNGRFGNDTATIVMAKVHNDAGVQLTNGMVVRFGSSGTNSDAPSVRLANNKHDSTSANTFGFVKGTIAINDTGYIILSGKIEKLNTSAFSNGDIIYLDSVNGQWTKNKPVAPNHLVYLGVIVKANNGNGSIFVKCQNGYELDEIHDVLITSKLNNQVLAYSDTQKVWKNRNIYSIVDTTNIIGTKTNLSLKLNTSDSTIYQTKYRSDTSRSNIYNAISGKGTGTVTSVAALTLGTSGTDLSSSVATGTTTPVITLNVPTASATNRGALSSTDWTTFNNKGYGLNLGCTQTSLSANTTYYFGLVGSNINTTGGDRRVYIPQSGTIKSCYIYLRTTSVTNGENWTISIRLNNSSNTTIATVSTASNQRLYSNNSLNISVSQGDYIEIIMTTPATAPAATFAYGSIFIQ